jgi:hypothetical protein
MKDMIENDPKMREEFMAELRNQVDMLYGDVADELDLDEDTEDKLNELLVERAKAGMDLGLAMMTGQQLSPEELAQKKAALDEAKAASDKQIESLLGASNARKFDEYEKSIPERQELQMMRPQMEQAGAKLTPQKEKAMMKVMAEARKQFLDETPNFNPEDLQKQMANYNRYVTDHTASILTPKQHQALKKSMEQKEKIIGELGAPGGPMNPAAAGQQ